MFFPTRDAMERASRLQFGSFSEGVESRTSAEERDVAVAIVHTRQDVVLIYSMLVDCHRQSVNISRGVWAVAVIGLLILAHLA